jgi:hypothetical protein
MCVSLPGTRGRSVGHMLFTRGASWLVVREFFQCQTKNPVMPAGMVLVAWSMEFDVWPARF